MTSTLTTSANNAVAGSQSNYLTAAVLPSHISFPSVSFLPNNQSLTAQSLSSLAMSSVQESTEASDAGGDKSKVIINGMVIDIETITSEELYALRKVLPKKDYR